MPNTNKFSELKGKARRDPARIDQDKARALDKQATYRLAELRQPVLGLTQAELAELIGKSRSPVSQIERGEIGLSLAMVRAIVAQLGGEVEIAAVFKNRRILLEA